MIVNKDIFAVLFCYFDSATQIQTPIQVHFTELAKQK